MNSELPRFGITRIRVHLASLGRPIVGDMVYGNAICALKRKGHVVVVVVVAVAVAVAVVVAVVVVVVAIVVAIT